MDDAAIERLLLVAALAVKVECRPQRRDGTAAAVYESSGATLARRIRAKPEDVTEEGCFEAAAPEAAHGWNIALKAGAARRTLYTAWLKESPEEVERILRANREREELRHSLPHHARKKAPWGPL
jgi:hypothetical protein